MRTAKTDVVFNPYAKRMKKPSQHLRFCGSKFKVHDRRKTDRIEAGAAYEKSVDLWLRHETLRILGLDAAAV